MLERGALERFVREYGDRAYRFAYGLCGNEPDARELVQEAFVRALDKAELFRDERPLEKWFLTLLKHLYFDGLRRWDRKSRISLDAPVGDEGLTVADALPDARDEASLDRLERLETRETVRDALARLRPEQRAVLLMVDVEGIGYEDAADVLGWPLGTVRSRVFRARAALRRRLLEREVSA